MEESFDLDDRFCDDDDDDDDDLETSWQKQKLFSNLFNIQKSLILADSVFNKTHLQLPDFVDDIDNDRKNENIKFTKHTSLYQIIYYILHAGKKKTPLHMTTAHAIYDKCKGRELITILIILNNASPKSKK